MYSGTLLSEPYSQHCGPNNTWAARGIGPNVTQQNLGFGQRRLKSKRAPAVALLLALALALGRHDGLALVQWAVALALEDLVSSLLAWVQRQRDQSCCRDSD